MLPSMLSMLVYAIFFLYISSQCQTVGVVKLLLKFYQCHTQVWSIQGTLSLGDEKNKKTHHCFQREQMVWHRSKRTLLLKAPK